MKMYIPQIVVSQRAGVQRHGQCVLCEGCCNWFHQVECERGQWLVEIVGFAHRGIVQE